MSRLIGRRGEGGSGWSWDVGSQGPPRSPRRPSLPPYALPVGAIVLLLALVFLLAWAFGSGEDNSTAARRLLAVGSPTGDAGGEPTAAGQTPAAPSPPPSDGDPQFRLALWSDRLNTWQFADLDADNSAYHEGEVVPLMLRIDDAPPRRVFTITIRYQCLYNGRNVYDFLTDYDRSRGTAPALAPEGPGLAESHAAAAMPDDPNIAFDDAHGLRRFQAWGAAVVVSPAGSLAAGCVAGEGQSAENEVVIEVQPQLETVWLLWGAHLASGLDWGQGMGVAGAPAAALRIQISDSGREIGQQERRILAVLPPVSATPGATATPSPPLTPTVAPTPPPVADLTVTTVHAPDPVRAGASLAYFVTVTNLGPAAAADVVLTDTLPAGATLIAITPSQGSCSGLSCQLGVIPAQGSASVSVTVRLDPGTLGTITNTACASSSTPLEDPSNDCDSEQTAVQ